MNLAEGPQSAQKLGIQSPRRLADVLRIPPGRLEEVAGSADANYSPFMLAKPPRPFERCYVPQSRPIDNPLQDLKWIQRRIYRRLLKPICFPSHILGAVSSRSVMDNAERHLSSALLVTLDVRQCFPSITNAHVYRVWSEFLGCSPPVSRLLTRLTTFERHLPQGAPTSPLLANIFIWMIDGPIRAICEQFLVSYSTWIDDLAFSGERSRDLIEPSISLLAAHGLRVKREKIRIMGPRAIKLLTGTRLGSREVRAPREKISRVRSGIHNLRVGLVPPNDEERYVIGLVGQIRFIHQVCPRDASVGAGELKDACKGHFLDSPSRRFLDSLG
ncbi:MAG: reverse transcriptase family protein [Candidatus Sulfotelmatobacter sp.]